MLLREGDGIFAAFGNPKGPDAYYAEVASENEAKEAAARAERQAILDGSDPVAWRKFIEEELNFDALHRKLADDLDAMTNRLKAGNDAFYPEPAPFEAGVSDFTRAMIGPDIYGTDYSRREGILSNFIGPVALSSSGGVFTAEPAVVA